MVNEVKRRFTGSWKPEVVIPDSPYDVQVENAILKTAYVFNMQTAVLNMQTVHAPFSAAPVRSCANLREFLTPVASWTENIRQKQKTKSVKAALTED